MPAIRIDRFGGMYPSLDDRLLPDGAAALARNAYLYSGALIGWRKPKELHTLVNSTTRKAVRIPVALDRTAITDASTWMEFDDADTDVIKSPVVDDTFSRYYFASPSVPPKYNTLDRIVAASPAFFLGVPAPDDAPSVSPADGGAGLATARTYVYTWVTAYGEEGPPSPTLIANGYTDDTWTIGVTVPTAANQGVDRNITKTRIYRTVTGSNGVTTYFLVAEINADVDEYADVLTDDIVAEQSELDSLNWYPPPSDLQGFVQAPNGMVVGFRENEVWFSEPFRPHAWPTQYVLTTEFPIVGLGVAGQAIVACTQGYPVVFQGIHPSAVTETHVRQSEPCVTRGSILSALQGQVSIGGTQGVYYISPNGLMQVSPYGAVQNVTETWITREKWAEHVPLRSARAARIGPTYFVFGSVFVDPATALEDASEADDGFSIDLTTEQPAVKFGKLTAPDDLSIYNLMMDFWTATPLLIQDGKVFYYDYADTEPEYMPYLWRSKTYQQPSKHNFEAMRVWFEVPAGTTPQNVTRNTDPEQTLADDQYGLIRVYADGVLRTTREIRTTGELLRIASGFKAEFWYWEIEARVRIFNLQTATSVKELIQV